MQVEWKPDGQVPNLGEAIVASGTHSAPDVVLASVRNQNPDED